MPKCKECGEIVSVFDVDENVVCKKCREDENFVWKKYREIDTPKIYDEVQVSTSNLIECKTCGKEISKNATSCPNCGEPLEKKNETKVEEVDESSSVLGSIGTFFVLIIIYVLIRSCGEDDTVQTYSPSTNISISECKELSRIINTTSDMERMSKAMMKFSSNNCDRRMGEPTREKRVQEIRDAINAYNN